MVYLDDLNYQTDVTVTLVDKNEGDYTLWIDTQDRLIRTENGINEEVTGYEKRKLLSAFGFEAFCNTGWYGSIN